MCSKKGMAATCVMWGGERPQKVTRGRQEGVQWEGDGRVLQCPGAWFVCESCKGAASARAHDCGNPAWMHLFGKPAGA